VHCLAGLIKAWFRELPCGVLDGLSPEEVLNCNTEEESVQLIKQLKPTESALLSWAVDLMADVVEEEESNKMNARNIAMVFAPNMTQVKTQTHTWRRTTTTVNRQVQPLLNPNQTQHPTIPKDPNKLDNNLCIDLQTQPLLLLLV